MPLLHLRNYALAWVAGRSALRARVCPRGGARIIFGLQSNAKGRVAIRGPSMTNQGCARLVWRHEQSHSGSD
jgi:hypothetical protein